MNLSLECSLICIYRKKAILMSILFRKWYSDLSRIPQCLFVSSKSFVFLKIVSIPCLNGNSYNFESFSLKFFTSRFWIQDKKIWIFVCTGCRATSLILSNTLSKIQNCQDYLLILNLQKVFHTRKIYMKHTKNSTLQDALRFGVKNS